MWAGALPRCRRSRASRERKPIRRGRCTGSSLLRRAAPTTSWRASSANTCRIIWDSNLSLRTGPAPPAMSACNSALNSAPDGYTIAFVGPNYAINPALYEKLPFDFIRDSVPVAGIMRLANVMDVNPTFPANNLAEFIAYAKANPGKINFASGGVGTSPHLSGELLKTMAGINLVHVPYRGTAPALADLLAGQVQVVFDNIPGSIGHI